MKIKTDSYFSIGSTHRVCEDYTAHSPTGIVVCDGCSSSDNTDVGARLLALTTLRCIEEVTASVSTLRCVAQAEVVAQSLGLKTSALDATLLFAYVLPDGGHVRIQMVGDGHVYIKARDGNVLHETRDFDQNAPFYATYMLDDARLCAWNASQVQCVSGVWETTLLINELESITLVTDGIDTITDAPHSKMTYVPHYTPPNYLELVSEFKTTTGSFQQRRMNFFERRLKKSSLVHQDDLGVATMLFENEA